MSQKNLGQAGGLLSGWRVIVIVEVKVIIFYDGTFVPTMKIATNSQLAAKKSNWIDFNAGVIVEDTPAAEVCVLEARRP